MTVSESGLPLEQHISIQKQLARELRQSNWWKNKKQNAVCAYCLKKIDPEDVTMDHIVPVSQGGKSIKSNINVSCKSCNTKKKDELVWDFSVEVVKE